MQIDSRKVRTYVTHNISIIYYYSTHTLYLSEINTLYKSYLWLCNDIQFNPLTPIVANMQLFDLTLWEHTLHQN